MVAFRVWIRSSGNNCRLRVDGMGNAQWLLNRLGHSFVFKTAAPMAEEEGSSCYTFRVAYSSHISPRELQRLLAAIPEVSLLADPA